MIIFHDCDGSSGPLADVEAFIARIAEASPEQWQGETGQIGLEHRGPKGDDWLYLSLVGLGRYLVFAQRRSGERIYAHDPQGAADLEHRFLLRGREMTVADNDLISGEEAADAALYFITQGGLLTPVVNWNKDGLPYWPDFE
jgi:hypothetical protein